jgi:hypothetical protein
MIAHKFGQLASVKCVSTSHLLCKHASPEFESRTHKGLSIITQLFREHFFFRLISVAFLSITSFVALSSGAPVTIVGPQKVVQSLTTLPYRHVGMISTSAGTGSGSVVFDKRLVLTAAHVVCDSAALVNTHQATWHPRHNESARPGTPGELIRGAWVFLDQGYATGYNEAVAVGDSEGISRDIAVCIAPQNESGITQEFSDGVLPLRLNARTLPLIDYAADPSLPKQIVGYPAHFGDGYMYQTVAIDDVYTDTPSPQPVESAFRVVSSGSWNSMPSLFSAVGMSGGPLLATEGVDSFVVGVHVSGPLTGGGSVMLPSGYAPVTRPGARMVTQEVIDQLLEPAKRAANAKITSSTAVSWPVGQQGVYQLEISPAGDFVPTDYHVVGMPTGMTRETPAGGLARLVYTPDAVGSAEVILFAWDKVHDGANFHPGWVPTEADPGCSLYVKIKFSFGQAVACGSQTSATLRYKRKDCIITGSQVRAFYRQDYDGPIMHEFCDGEGLASTYLFLTSGSWAARFRSARRPIYSITRCFLMIQTQHH